jgi:hypothetical protein
MSAESLSWPCYSEFGWRTPCASREPRRIVARLPNQTRRVFSWLPRTSIRNRRNQCYTMQHDATRNRETTAPPNWCIAVPSRVSQAFAKYPHRGNPPLHDATRNVTNRAPHARGPRRPSQPGRRLAGPATRTPGPIQPTYSTFRISWLGFVRPNLPMPRSAPRCTNLHQPAPSGTICIHRQRTRNRTLSESEQHTVTKLPLLRQTSRRDDWKLQQSRNLWRRTPLAPWVPG